MASSAPSFSTARAQRLDDRVVDAVGDQRADLAALERRLGLLDQAQRRRRIHVDRVARRRDACRPCPSMPSACSTRVRRASVVDDHQVAEHAACGSAMVSTLRELEREALHDVALLGLGHRAEEQARLAVVIGEASPAGCAACRLARRRRSALRRCGSRAPGFRAGRSDRGCSARRRRGPWRRVWRMMPVALEVAHRARGRLIGSSWKFGAAEAQQLRVGVGEQPPCSSGSLVKSMPGTTWPGWNAACSVSAKKLSGLRSSTILPISSQRHHLLGDQLGRVEHVEVENVGESSSVERLDRRTPTRGSRRSRSPRTGRGGGSPDRRR